MLVSVVRVGIESRVGHTDTLSSFFLCELGADAEQEDGACPRIRLPGPAQGMKQR